ncbi:MAG: slr1659 superfamily regulator [Elainella sp.]
MEIKTEDYGVSYSPEEQVICCWGTLRLPGTADYAPIAALLDQVVAAQPPQVTLDLQNLKFLNTSGINVLSKFVIKLRQQETIQLTIKGSDDIPWQGRSLKNLQRLMPSLRLMF